MRSESIRRRQHASTSIFRRPVAQTIRRYRLKLKPETPPIDSDVVDHEIENEI